MADWTLNEGDCLDLLPTLEAASVGSVVTDPPYDLTANKKGGTGTASINLDSPYGRARIGTGNGGGGFMGQAWDGTGIAFRPDLWAEVLRVMKPGAYLVAFGGTRTYHRMACAIEDAGFIIKDSLHWIYGSGFPKSLNLGDGYGTALKPAHEPIILAQKPLQGTYAANVARHGVGALNIDGCRVGLNGERPPTGSGDRRGGAIYAQDEWTRTQMANGGNETSALGRWPTNLLLTHDPNCVPLGTRRVRSNGHYPSTRGEGGYSGGFSGQAGLSEHHTDGETVDAWHCAPGCPVAVLDAQSGALTTNPGTARREYEAGMYGPNRLAGTVLSHGDSGGASRFYPTFRFEDDDFAHLADPNAESVVQYTRNSETTEGAEWASQDRSRSIRAASDQPQPKAITASMSSAMDASEPPWPTSSNGSVTTARSPKATKSTTATSISSTTPSPTLNSLTPSPISDCTAGANCETASGGNRAECAASSSPSPPSISTSAAKVGPSTGAAAPVISVRWSPLNGGDVPPFMYQAKASRSERRAGLPRSMEASHPTVKPLMLMRWLVRLVCPPGETVLDPFLGSGTTGVAALMEGRGFIGIEREAAYLAIARRRLETAQPGLPLGA